MNYSVAKTIGLNNDQQAAQVVSSKLDEENGFLAVLELTCDDAFTRGRSLLSQLQDFYLEEEGTPAEKITKIFEKAKESLQEADSFSVLLAAISGKVLYLISQGQVECYLKRGNSFSSLLNGGDGQLISGFLESGDRVLFTTKALTHFLGDDLKKSLTLSLTDWEEEITSRITNPTSAGDDVDEPMSSLAGLLLEFNLNEKQPAETQIDLEEKKVDSNQDQEAFPEEKPDEGPKSPPQDLADLDQSVNIPISPAQTESSLAFLSDQKSRFGRIVSAVSSTKKAARFFPTGRKGRLIIAGLLIIILIVGLGFKFKASKDQETKTQVASLVSSAREDLNSAVGLQTLNPQEANSKLDSAKQKLAQALALNSKDPAALDLKNQIDAQGNQIAGKFEASKFEMYLDLDLIKTGFQAQNLAVADGVIKILDPVNKTLVEFNMAKKSNQILAGKEQLGEAVKVGPYEGADFVYSTDKGILRVDSGNQKITEVAKPDSEWGNIVDLYGFGGNVYVLDSVKNQIWKYLPTNDGYSDKREYLTSDTNVDFSDAIRMQIDSSVYVLKSSGAIAKFTKGAVDSYTLTGLDKPLSNPKSLFVSGDTENLYILDSGNSRLVVTSKTGEFKKQYQGDKFTTASDLIVDESANKAYILESNKIYQVDLN